VNDPRVDRMATVLVDRMLQIADHDLLVIDAPSLAAALVRPVIACAAVRGAEILLLGGIEGADRALLDASSAAVLAREHRAHTALMRLADCTLRIDAGWQAQPLAGVPADRYSAWLAGRASGSALRMQRAAAGTLRWAVTLHPCDAYAQAAGLSLEAFADLVYRAAFCDQANPIAAWQRQGEQQQRLAEFFEAAREVRLVADGTDLRMRIDGRRWRNSCASRNLPDGEVFTGPIEGSATGVISFSYPATHAGRVVDGIRLRLDDGVVVEATARDGQDVLDALLRVDDGARRLGELGIGTNYRLDRFTGRTLLDEKIGGTVHIALGSGYAETGSQNRSALHWDLVADLRGGGEIIVDGVTVQRNGVFVDPLGVTW
jgi:aminopeptidase